MDMWFCLVLLCPAWFCLILLGSAWFCLVLPCCEGARKVQLLYILDFSDGYVVLLGSALLQRYP